MGVTSEPSPSNNTVAQLLVVLDDLVPMLKELGELHWADWMERSRHLIRASDFAGIELLLSAYGGMGSFNDIQGNVRLDRLRNRAYEFAESIRRNSN